MSGEVRRAPLVVRAVLTLMVLLAGAAAAPGAQGKETWFSGFSTIVVDAKTGEVIDSAKADELRHPASLAKIMTLYLLFAELDAGRLKLDSKIQISEEAAKQPPSKLGLKPGDSIEVEAAIKALVTRSANDIAVAIAEAVAGDEASFARMMTQRARTLGMKRTVFTNANGLPDADQVTTAREMALLGLAVQDRFPKYYPYFSTRKFHWRGVAIGNHNRLLGRVDGVDGIKTGYTRASGFNLVSNVKRDGRHIVAVVLGGRTGASRDAHMREMISQQIRHASVGPRTAPRFAESQVPMPVPSPVTTAALRPPAPAPGSADPIARKPVRLVSVDKDGEIVSEGDRPNGTIPVNTLSAASVQAPLQPTPTGIAPSGKIVTFAPPPPPSQIATASTQTSTEVVERKAVVVALATDAKTERAIVLSALAAEPKFSSTPAQAAIEKAQKIVPTRGDWIIQVGAFPTAAGAEKRLVEAQKSAAAVLADGDPYTEKTTGKKSTLYRARFAGFDEAAAKRACDTLKKNDIACFVARN